SCRRSSAGLDAHGPQEVRAALALPPTGPSNTPPAPAQCLLLSNFVATLYSRHTAPPTPARHLDFDGPGHRVHTHGLHIRAPTPLATRRETIHRKRCGAW